MWIVQKMVLVGRKRKIHYLTVIDYKEGTYGWTQSINSASHFRDLGVAYHWAELSSGAVHQL